MLISSTDPDREFKAALFRAIETLGNTSNKSRGLHIKALRQMIKMQTGIDIYNNRMFVYQGRQTPPSLPRLSFCVGSLYHYNIINFCPEQYFYDDFYNAIKKARDAGPHILTISDLHDKTHWVRDKRGNFFKACDYFIHEGEAYRNEDNCLIDGVLYKNRAAIDIEIRPNDTSAPRSVKMLLNEGEKAHCSSRIYLTTGDYIMFNFSSVHTDPSSKRKTQYLSWSFFNSFFKHKDERMCSRDNFYIDIKEFKDLEFDVSQAHKDFVKKMAKTLSTKNVNWASRFISFAESIRISVNLSSNLVRKARASNDSMLKETIIEIANNGFFTIEEFPKVLELLKSLVKEVYKNESERAS